MSDPNATPADTSGGNDPSTNVSTGLEGTDKPVIGGHRATDKDGKPADPSKPWIPGQKPRDPLDIDLQKFIAIQKLVGGKAEDVQKFLDSRNVLANARKEAEVKAADAVATSAATTATTPGVKTDAEKAAELLAKQTLDNQFTDVKATEIKAPTAPVGWGAQYIAMDKWDTPVKDVVNPHNLTMDNWELVLISNKTRYGYVVREAQKDIVKARAAAFEPKSLTKAFPEFEVYDCSSISIKETKTSLQKSLAENGFTSNAVESAVSGGAFGVSAGLSTSLRTSSSSADASNDQSEDKEYYATYNFPRVRLYMDEQNLRISDACMVDIKVIEDTYDAVKKEEDTKVQDIIYDKADQLLQQFSKKYGHVFATAFQLGGQLQGTKSASSLLMQSESDKRDALKTSVAVSFSSMYASGSAKYAYENQQHVNEKEQQIQDLNSLAWTARGGNTLLCANPPQWAGTVAGFESWRVIEQEEVLPLHTLIGRFGDPYTKVPKLFEELAQRRVEAQKKDVSLGSWQNKIILRLPTEKKRLALNDRDSGTVVATNDKSATAPPEPVFTVLSGNFDDTGKAQPLLSMLPADYPLFLLTGKDYSRDKNKGNQIQGLWVNGSGQLKPETAPGSWICRWSFRKPDFTSVPNSDDLDYPTRPMQDAITNDGNNTWNPLANQEIKDGDFVQLYCHSVNYGVFRDLTHPPKVASRVLFDDNKNQFVALGYDNPANWGNNRLYDAGTKDQGIINDMYKHESDVLNSTALSRMWSRGSAVEDFQDHISWKRYNGYNTKAIFQVHFVLE